MLEVTSSGCSFRQLAASAENPVWLLQGKIVPYYRGETLHQLVPVSVLERQLLRCFFGSNSGLFYWGREHRTLFCVQQLLPTC